MKIKVKNIQIREILQYGKGNLTHNTKIPVVEAKLVLLHDQPMKRGDVDSPIGGMAPILISETEKIEEGDYILINNTIKKCIGFLIGEFTIDLSQADILCDNNLPYQRKACKKILALPEHFTLMQLDHLVWGNLRNGDKVYVECYHFDSNTVDDIIAPPIVGYFVKSPLSIYPIEEKMYTSDEVKEIIRQTYVDGYENGYIKGVWAGEIDKCIAKYLK